MPVRGACATHSMAERLPAVPPESESGRKGSLGCATASGGGWGEWRGRGPEQAGGEGRGTSGGSGARAGLVLRGVCAQCLCRAGDGIADVWVREREGCVQL